MTPWPCQACQEPQISWAPLPADRLCQDCRETARLLAQVEKNAGIPTRYQNLTRSTWSKHFHTRWPAEVATWSGHPHWLAIWGPTGTGKTACATILLAEHLKRRQEGGVFVPVSPLPEGGRGGDGRGARGEVPFVPVSPLPAGGWVGEGRGARGEGAFAFRAAGSFPTGHWISALTLAEKLRREINTDGDTLGPLLVTGLLVIDEPLAVDATPWFFDRLSLLCRTRDEAGLPTIVTLQQEPEELITDNPPAPPALISRWLSGTRLFLGGEDVRLREIA